MLARMRIAFLGNDPWSVPSLERLAAASEIDVAVVATRVPRPAGRGSKLTPTKVAEAARALGLPLVETESVRGGDGFEVLRDVKPDVLVVVAYGEILTADVLYLATPVNVHFSLLPRWRGAAPVQRAILAGDRTTGVTVMLMDEGLDTGPILAQRDEPIHPDDDTGTLGTRLASAGATLLVETLPMLTEIEPTPQAGENATLAPKLSSEERSIDWSEDAEAIVRRVRAFAPRPGAVTRLRTGSVKVLRAEVAPDAPSGGTTPGTVAMVDVRGFTVAAAGGCVRPLEVGPAGRNHMTAAEFVRGWRLQPGERLG
jgi:methionyl-tRNA formyltransferase